MPSDKEWAQIAHEIKWVDEAHTPRIPVKYWIPVDEEPTSKGPKKVQGDDPRTSQLHPAHHEIAWVSCIVSECKMHLAPKKKHKAFPTRVYNDPHTDIILQEEVHGWHPDRKHGGYLILAPGPLLPLECVMGRPWYECPENRCLKYVAKKVHIKH